MLHFLDIPEAVTAINSILVKFILFLIRDADNTQELRNKWERSLDDFGHHTYVPFGVNIQA